MLEQLEEQFTKYEIARILGARALQIAMDAPLLLKIDEKELEEINYNPIEIAKLEFAAGVLPITVNRPMPKKREGKIKILSKEEIEAARKAKELEEAEKKRIEEEKAGKTPGKEDEKIEAEEEEEEKEIAEGAEIMELATPEDETEEVEASETEEA